MAYSAFTEACLLAATDRERRQRNNDILFPLLLGMYFIRCTQLMQRDTELYNTSEVVSASTLLNESSDGSSRNKFLPRGGDGGL